MVHQRRLVHFFGSVQGVGFRYTAMRVAEGCDVAGYVRNLPDGRVEVVVEGLPEQIDSFLQAIRERMGHYIHRTDQQVSEPTGRFTGFDIRF